MLSEAIVLTNGNSANSPLEGFRMEMIAEIGRIDRVV